jgi:hypothetical protein
MAEQKPTKTGRFQRWRERRRAKAARTRGIAGRAKAGRAAAELGIDMKGGTARQ